MDWKFVLGLSGITLLVIGVVIIFGRKINKVVLQRAPDTSMALHITPAGSALWACVVSLWLICLVAAKLRPDSPLGAFSGSLAGAGLVLAGSMLIVAVAAAILEKFGYPIAVSSEKH